MAKARLTSATAHDDEIVVIAGNDELVLRCPGDEPIGTSRRDGILPDK
jgi:hypothetical protein